MTKGITQHVVPYENGWAVYEDWKPDMLRFFSTQEAAVEHARRKAMRCEAPVLFHNATREQEEPVTLHMATGTLTLQYPGSVQLLSSNQPVASAQENVHFVGETQNSPVDSAGCFMLKKNRRLVLVSNREPYTVKVNEETIQLEKTPGGLVSALDPVMRENQGLWICWEGATKRIEEFDETPTLADLAEIQHSALPYEIRTVDLSESEINHYYYGYANTRLWPLFHYFPTRCDFMDDKGWPNYESANRKFAETVIRETTDEDLIWVQDYHLFLVPAMVREQARHRRIGFFCHIPFPQYEVFRILPKRKQILEGLLGCNLIGFHTPQYVHHFLECVENLLSEESAVVDWEHHQVRYEGRLIQVRDYPISIDFKLISKLAGSESVKSAAQKLREAYPTEWIGIGLDRLDYTKGILERLEAIRVLFEKYPQYKKRLTFVQIASPTRTEVKMYREMKEQVEQAVGRINGQLAEDGWAPIHYFYKTVGLQEIVPYFAIADFALVTPLRDGMNLVAKEYCAARMDNDGVLILSEFAGTAHELNGALQVNPFDLEDVADQIHQGLQMPKAIRLGRMSHLRETIAAHDIHHWVEQFLECFHHVSNQQV